MDYKIVSQGGAFAIADDSGRIVESGIATYAIAEDLLAEFEEDGDGVERQKPGTKQGRYIPGWGTEIYQNSLVPGSAEMARAEAAEREFARKQLADAKLGRAALEARGFKNVPLVGAEIKEWRSNATKRLENSMELCITEENIGAEFGESVEQWRERQLKRVAAVAIEIYESRREVPSMDLSLAAFRPA
jgi:hypothetical protein